MKIGIDINPTIDSIVGKGYFLKSILETLSSIDRKNEYILFGREMPSYNIGENFTFHRITGQPSIFWDLKCVFSAKFQKRVDIFFTVKSFYSAILHNKSVLLIHDIGPLKFPDYYPEGVVARYQNLIKTAIRRTKKIVTPSAYTKSYIVNHYNVDHKKIVRIAPAAPNWTKNKVRIEDYDRVNEKYSLGKNYFLFAGTLEPRKNLNILIEAFKKFKENDKNNYKLLLVGKKGYKHEEIVKIIIDNELSHDVILTGHVPESDLKPIFKNSKAFVFTSLLEGFALSALEAMACGIPVICSKKAAIGETVGDACLEIDPSDVDSIKESLEKIVKDKELVERLVRKGEKRVKIYSWKKSAKKLLKVFTEVNEK